MEKLTLQFKSPKALNELSKAQSVEKKNWYYHQTELLLELDTASWSISSGASVGKIDNWMINEDTCEMILYEDALTSSVEGFSPLDYPFAVSMIGQIGSSAYLQDYLESLKEVYDAVKPVPKPDNESEKQ